MRFRVWLAGLVLLAAWAALGFAADPGPAAEPPPAEAPAAETPPPAHRQSPQMSPGLTGANLREAVHSALHQSPASRDTVHGREPWLLKGNLWFAALRNPQSAIERFYVLLSAFCVESSLKPEVSSLPSNYKMGAGNACRRKFL